MSEPDGLPAPERYRVMFSIILGGMLINIDSAIANIALPTIARELAATDAATVWVVNGYQLALAVCLLPAAALAEIFGAKLIYAVGLVVFMIASLTCALSPTLGILVASRLLQGIGGSCVAALGPALIREIYPRRILGKGLALIALSVAVSAAIGPTIAALILSVANWPWLFLVNLPFCFAAIPLFIAAAPAGRRQQRPFDLVGALLNAVALGLIVIGVDELAGSHKGLAMAELAGGLASFGLLVLQQRRRSLLLPLDLLRIPLFALSIGTSICSYAAQILAYVSLPFLFQIVLHRSQTMTGLLVTPWPLLVAVAAIVAGRLSTRYPASILSSIGLGVLAVGLLLMAALPGRADRLGHRMAHGRLRHRLRLFPDPQQHHPADRRPRRARRRGRRDAGRGAHDRLVAGIGTGHLDLRGFDDRRPDPLPGSRRGLCRRRRRRERRPFLQRPALRPPQGGHRPALG